MSQFQTKNTIIARRFFWHHQICNTNSCSDTIMITTIHSQNSSAGTYEWH